MWRINKKRLLSLVVSFTLVFTNNPFTLKQWKVITPQSLEVSLSLYDTVIDGKLNQDLFKFSKAETERNKELFGNCYDKRFEDFVFVRPDGYIITPTYVSSHFSQFLKKIDIEH